MRSFPVLIAALVCLAGCDPDATGALVDEPLVPEADVEELISVLAVYDSVLATEPMESLRELGPALVETFTEGEPAEWAFPVAQDRSNPSFSEGLRLPFPEMPLVTAALPSIRPSIAGRTFVFDQGLGRYAPAQGRLGAPGNGVRIALYQPRRGRIQEIGWIDVTENGASLPNAYRVQVRGIERGRLFAAYNMGIDGPAGPGLLRPTAIGLDGRVIAGSELLQFDLESKTPDPFNPTLDLRFLVSLLNRGFSIEATVSGVPPSGQGVENLDFFLPFRGWRWRVRYNDRGGRIDALVTVNGNELASATGVVSQPTVVGSAGRTLSPRTRFLIIRILLVASGMFELHNDLFTPPGSVILQGLN